MKHKIFSFTSQFILLLFVVGCYGNEIDNRTVIHLLILDSPTSIDIYYPFAIKYINNLTDMFPSFQLQTKRLVTDQYDTGSAAKAFIDGYFTPPQKALVIGPFLSQQAQSVADVAKYYHVTEIGTTGTSPALSDKKAYPYYFRMCGIDSQYTELIMRLLLKYKWRKIGLLAADSTGFYPVALELEDAMKSYNITQFEKVIFNQEPSDQIGILVKKDIRIFIIVRIVFYERGPTRLECQIAKYKLFGPKYMWIQLGFTQSTSPFFGGCNRAEAMAAIEGSLEFDSAISDISFPRPISMLGLTAEEMLDELKSASPAAGRFATASTIYGLDLKFDSILAAALAINRTLQTEVYRPDEIVKGDTSFKRVLFNSFKALDFVGLSGRVAFNDKNDRTSMLLVYQIRNMSRDLVATFDPTDNQINWLKNLWFAGGKPPVDSPQLELRPSRLSRASAAAVAGFSGAGVLLSIVSIMLSIGFRRESAFSLSCPITNNCIAIGCLLCYSACVVMAVNAYRGATVEFCWAQTAVLAGGYSIAMGAMLTKSWRTHRIYADKRLINRKPISNWHLSVAISIGICLDALTLIAWALTDPLQVVVMNLGDTELESLGKIIRHQVAICQSNSHNIWIGALVGVKVILLLFGVFFAWETRNIQLAVINDSKQIGYGIYNTLVMGFVGLALGFTLPVSEIELSTCLLASCVLICLTVILALVFGHKVLILTGHVIDTPDFNNGSTVDRVGTNWSSAAGQSRLGSQPPSQQFGSSNF